MNKDKLIEEFKLTMFLMGSQDSRAEIPSRTYLLSGRPRFARDEYIRGYRIENAKKPEITG